MELKNKIGHNLTISQPVEKIKPVRALEFICFSPFAVPTKEEGPGYVYLSVAAFSGFTFMTGVEKDTSDNNILKHVYLLTEEEKFKVHLGKPFTIVFNNFEHLHTAISNIIAPLGGKIMINDPYVRKVANPIIMDFLKAMASGEIGD